MEDWSQDGKYIIYQHGNINQAISALPISGDSKSFSIVESPFDLDEPHLSFSGKWIAYNSNESGIWEIIDYYWFFSVNQIYFFFRSGIS